MEHLGERDMKDINHTLQLSAATMLALLLGSYLYSSSANIVEPQDSSTVNADAYLDERAEIEGVETINSETKLRETHID